MLCQKQSLDTTTLTLGVTMYNHYHNKDTNKFNMAPKGSLLGNLMERADVEPQPNTGEAPSFQSNQSWDAIDGISHTVATMLVDVAMEINSTIRLINSANVNNREVFITVEGLKRDLQSYTEKLVALKQKHQGRAGQVVSSDEYSYCMSVGLEYMSMNEEIRALLFQPLTTLTEYANVALQQLNAQNPDVVTDVVTKEVV